MTSGPFFLLRSPPSFFSFCAPWIYSFVSFATSFLYSLSFLASLWPSLPRPVIVFYSVFFSNVVLYALSFSRIVTLLWCRAKFSFFLPLSLSFFCCCSFFCLHPRAGTILDEFVLFSAGIMHSPLSLAFLPHSYLLSLYIAFSFFPVRHLHSQISLRHNH